MVFGMEEKIKMLDQYIAALEGAIAVQDDAKAESLVEEIIGVYANEIQDITLQLNRYRWGGGRYIDDAVILKAKLLNYKYNLSSGLIKLFQSDSGINLTQQVYQETNTTVAISLDQVINTVNALQSDKLTDEEKEIISGKLATISAEEDKEKRWKRIGSALKWIADKSVDVGAAVLPYLLEHL